MSTLSVEKHPAAWGTHPSPTTAGAVPADLSPCRLDVTPH